MRTISHEVVINAAVKAVWRILVDFPSHAAWNPFMQFEKGTTIVGERLAVRIRPPGGRGTRFTPVLVECDPPNRYAWRGRLGPPGVLDGHHQFFLTELSPQQTLLRQEESFSGLLVPLLGSTLKKTRHGFEMMNTALKSRAESANRQSPK
jgi:hypothetical protein